MERNVESGATLANAVAALFVAAPSPLASSEQAARLNVFGASSCKGISSCKGHSSCKGMRM